MKDTLCKARILWRNRAESLSDTECLNTNEIHSLQDMGAWQNKAQRLTDLECPNSQITHATGQRQARHHPQNTTSASGGKNLQQPYTAHAHTARQEQALTGHTEKKAMKRSHSEGNKDNCQQETCTKGTQVGQIYITVSVCCKDTKTLKNKTGTTNRRKEAMVQVT